MHTKIALPQHGLDKTELLEQLDRLKSDDVDWRHGRSWSLVYYAGDEHTDFVKQVYSTFFSENGAGPSMFPSLRRMEAEVVAMVCDLLSGNDGEVGTMTSGGTESILLAVKAYRDRARDENPGLRKPEIIVPQSAHPAFLKAADYFDIKVIGIPLNDGFMVDTGLVEKAITEQTICIVGSAPSLAYGVVDPIAELGRIALEHGIGLHVDACLGSFLLPFIKRLGHHITGFDFSVPGVTSISADLHKNGYTAKGSSVVLYKNPDLRRYQYYVNTDWPGGLYASPTMQGTRPGGAIASAWAAMMALGEDGYLGLARRAMETAGTLKQGIESIPELFILGQPEMNVLSFSSNSLDIHALGARLDALDWRVNRQNNPPAMHMIATPNHEQSVEQFISDLETVVGEEKQSGRPANAESAAVLYGGTINTSGHTDQTEAAYQRLDDLYIP